MRTILVADDSLDAGRTLTTLLEVLGYTVVRVEDGISALHVADEVRPRLMFLDICMPELSGWEVCRQIRARPWGSEPRIVAVTGYGSDLDRSVSQDAGFDEHCTKPISLETVERILGGL